MVWSKLDIAVPHFMTGELGLELRDKAGKEMLASFTPVELSKFLAAVLDACGMMAFTAGMDRVRPESAPRVKLTSFRVLPHERPDMAVFVALCGPVPIAFEVPLADMFGALDKGLAKG